MRRFEGTTFIDIDKGITAEAKTVYPESIGFETEDGEEIILTKAEIRNAGSSYYDIKELMKAE